MSSGSTVFLFSFDIFSIEPISTGSARRSQRCLPCLANAFDLDVDWLDPVAVSGAIGLVNHHALRKQPGKWLIHADIAAFVHRARKEARVKQM